MAQVFSNEFLEQLPDNPHEAFALIHSEYRKASKQATSEQELCALALDAYSYLQLFLYHKFDKTLTPIDPNSSLADILNHVSTSFKDQGIENQEGLNKLRQSRLIDESHSTYVAFFDNDPFAIRATDEQIENIHSLIAELRNQINETDALDDAHKRRIIKHLDRMQAEMRKTVSNLDATFAFFTDTLLLLRKSGEATDPIASTVLKLSTAVAIVVGLYYGLPPAPETIFPLLPAKQVKDPESRRPEIETIVNKDEQATKSVAFKKKPQPKS